MKMSQVVLLMGTALAASAGLDGAAFASGQGMVTGLRAATAGQGALVLVDGSDEDDEGGGGWLGSWGEYEGGDDDAGGDGGEGGDDAGGDGGDDCDEDEDGGAGACAGTGAGNAAKAGTVAPPKNGLFTDGTAPVVTTN